MIKFFPGEIRCFKWQCWAAIRLPGLALLCGGVALQEQVHGAEPHSLPYGCIVEMLT